MLDHVKNDIIKLTYRDGYPHLSNLEDKYCAQYQPIPSKTDQIDFLQDNEIDVAVEPFNDEGRLSPGGECGQQTLIRHFNYSNALTTMISLWHRTTHNAKRNVSKRRSNIQPWTYIFVRNFVYIVL